MAQTLLIDNNSQSIDLKNLSKDPESSLKAIIAQQTSGQINKDYFHAIIRTVMPKNDNNLKRLLYYYLETLDSSDKCFMMCINQVTKDLSSPNEYIRGLVLRFASRIDNYDYISILLKSIKENLNYKSSYVRLNAVYCLTEIAMNFDVDIDQDLFSLLKKENSPDVLKVIFSSLHKLGLSFDNYLHIEYPEPVLETLVEISDDTEFLLLCIESKHKFVSFRASCKLLRKGVKKIICTENLLRILESNEELKYDFLNYIKYVDGNALGLLNMIDFFQLEFSSKIIEQAFANAETYEFLKIAETLYNKYTECNSTSESRIRYKVLLLESMGKFASSHCVYIKDMLNICLKNLLVEASEIVYAGLKFISVCMNSKETSKESKREIIDFLIGKISEIKQGKFLRLVFDIITNSVTKEQYDRILDILLENFDKKVYYLSQESEVFLGTHICLCLSFMNRKEWDLKEKTLGVMLKFIEYGNKNNLIDFSSKSTISLCVRSVLEDVENKSSEVEEYQNKFKKVDVLAPIDFSLLKNYANIKKYVWECPLDSKSTTVQLSGLGDPLYIEANVIYNKYELVIDMLILNQTGSYLQDINLDFTTSKHLNQLSKLQPISLQPNSASTVKLIFSINESSNCFITATVSFKYPKRAEYASKPYVQNLSEITLNVNEFLESADVDFKECWKDLEWENIYSVTLAKADPSVLLLKVVKELNGEVCDRQSCFNFLVANIACYTIQRTLILVNACFSVADSTSVEIRVRSSDEEIVKSVSNLIASSFKSLK